MIILPRQARDKHREITPKRVPFSCSTAGAQGFGYSCLTEVGGTGGGGGGMLGLLWEKQVVGTHEPTDLAFSLIPLL
jgi:hypothetical protein